MSRARLARSAPVRKLLLEFAGHCDEMAKAARDAAEHYSWAEPAAWDRTVGDSAKTRATGPSDTTGSIVVGKDAMRSILRRANGKALAGVNRMKEAGELYEQALERTDHHRPEPSRSRPYPRTVGDAELLSLQAAQERRNGRGEGHA